MPARLTKTLSLSEAAARIPDGATLALGGLSYFNAPMSLVRELIRRNARNLTLITAAVTGIQADLLIAAGCVRRILTPYIAFEELGLAPAFRRAVEKHEITLVEMGEAFLAFGLKAAASGAPYYPLPLALAASDCVRHNPLYRVAPDPFSDRDVLCVPALTPDFTLLHAQISDEFGNLVLAPAASMDVLLARASRRVLATCDELHESEAMIQADLQAAVPGAFVAGVVHLPGAARPTSSPGLYGVDRAEFKRYTAAMKGDETRRSYFAACAGAAVSEADYLRSRGALPPEDSAPPAAAPAPLDAPASKAELIAVVLARAVRDGEFTAAGTGCWEVAAGLRLAQLTHAPNLTFTLGGTAAVNHRLPYLPVSINTEQALVACEARIELDDLFDLELAGQFDVMFASGLQIDRYGNLNLTCIGPYDQPVFRGPGAVGLEFAPRARRIVAFFRQHTKNIFVEKVDFVSGIGYGTGPGSRAQWGIPDSVGPSLVVTNLAVLDYDPQTQQMRLQSVHPGVSISEILANTGFELHVPASVPETPLPAPEELRLLRTEIDRGGMLRKLIP